MHRLTRIAFILLFSAPSLACAWGAVRIDGSSEAAADHSFQRMMHTLKPDRQQALLIALMQINFAGVNSVTDTLKNAELQHPSAGRVRDKIAGMTADDIIAYSKHVSSTTVIVEGQEPGIPADLLRPLAGGPPSISLADSTWVIDDEVNGRHKRDVYTLHADHTMSLIESEKTQGGHCRWEQAGDQVRFSFSEGFSINLGSFVDATTIKGDGGNKNGFRWTWTATKR
jgi:hypothetical protein